MAKKIIKHLTCRRPLPTHVGSRASGRTAHGAKSKVAGGSDRRWTQTFKIGYIEQAFKRTCVRESLQHGEANAAYRQRADVMRTSHGKASVKVKFTPTDSPVPQMQSVSEAVQAFDAAAFTAGVPTRRTA